MPGNLDGGGMPRVPAVPRPTAASQMAPVELVGPAGCGGLFIYLLLKHAEVQGPEIKPMPQQRLQPQQ